MIRSTVTLLVAACALLSLAPRAPAQTQNQIQNRAQTLPPAASLRAEDLRVIRGTPLEREYGDMLLNFMVHQAADATLKRHARLNAIQSVSDFTDWQEVNRTRFLELIGGLPGKPGEVATLNPRVAGEVAREGYVVRKVIFESLPEFYVTANLYVPTTGQPPFPAVLSPCGHSENGKAYDVYQYLFIGLVKRGYVVLTYDPPGQGERLQYWDFIHHRNFLPNPDDQHAMAGLQEYLLGQNLARYFIWDGVRALDYLTSLPEVDKNRIGVTGSSGGGTLTTYISMLDPRVKAASIVTFITSIPKKIEARINDYDADPEQDVAGLLAAGIDHTEFIGMIAPRPVLIGAATRDFFPIEGTHKTFAEAERLYRTIGAPERVKMVEFDHTHQYSQPLREATYAWFDRWLKGTENQAPEPPITVEKDATLACTPTGQVATSLGGKRLYDFNRAEAERLIDRLGLERRPGGSGSSPQMAPQMAPRMAGRIVERLGLARAPAAPRVARVGETTVADLTVEKVLLTAEPGIVVPMRLVRRQASASGAAQPAPPSGNAGAERLPVVLYLEDRSAAEDPALFERLARQGRLVVIADVRGMGETKSARNVSGARADYFDPRDGMDADFAYDSFFLGRPLLGMRVEDARAAVRFVRSRPDADPQHIAIAGRGWAGVVALFTAAVEPEISALAVEGAPVSFAEVAQAELYEQPASLMVPGLLRDFDLTDVLASLAPRPLLVLNPQDALAGGMDRAQATRSLAPVRDAYRAARAETALDYRVALLDSDVRQALEKWLSEPPRPPSP